MEIAKIAQLQEQLETLPLKIKEATNEYADKLEIFRILDKTEKSLLAKLGCDEEGSEAKRERLSRIRPAYLDHIKAMAHAEADMIKAKGVVEARIRLLESARTLISLEKVHAKIL